MANILITNGLVKPHLEIKPEDCSPIGLLLLQHMEFHQLSFTQMADNLGISRAALRIACLKNGNPGKRMIPKLAAVLELTELELKRLISENKLNQIYENNAD